MSGAYPTINRPPSSELYDEVHKGEQSRDAAKYETKGLACKTPLLLDVHDIIGKEDHPARASGEPRSRFEVDDELAVVTCHPRLAQICPFRYTAGQRQNLQEGGSRLNRIEVRRR